MFREGAIIVFGPAYARATEGIMRTLKDPSQGQVLLGCERIADLDIPDTPMLWGMLVFAHVLPARTGGALTNEELQQWSDKLLEGISLKPQASENIACVAEEPEIRFNADKGNTDILLTVTWNGVESAHCVAVARALEQSYQKHGGQYGPVIVDFRK
jgi:hypothetical protein